MAMRILGYINHQATAKKGSKGNEMACNNNEEATKQRRKTIPKKKQLASHKVQRTQMTITLKFTSYCNTLASMNYNDKGSVGISTTRARYIPLHSGCMSHL
jgi:hypothetical protein